MITYLSLKTLIICLNSQSIDIFQTVETTSVLTYQKKYNLC